MCIRDRDSMLWFSAKVPYTGRVAFTKHHTHHMHDGPLFVILSRPEELGLNAGNFARVYGSDPLSLRDIGMDVRSVASWLFTKCPKCKLLCEQRYAGREYVAGDNGWTGGLYPRDVTLMCADALLHKGDPITVVTFDLALDPNLYTYHHDEQLGKFFNHHLIFFAVAADEHVSTSTEIIGSQTGDGVIDYEFAYGFAAWVMGEQRSSWNNISVRVPEMKVSKRSALAPSMSVVS